MLKESLLKLKTLVDTLEDRDQALKNDHNLFEKFFESFPVPICMWSVNKEGKVLSCKGNGFLNSKAVQESELFLETDHRDSVDQTESSEDGTKELFLEREDRTYYVKIVEKIVDGVKIGSFGMGWDITSNLTILGSLTKIREIEESKENPDQEIIEWTTSGISSSRLRILIERICNK